MWISLCASDPLMMGCVPSHKSDMNDRVLVGPFNPSRVFGVALVRLFYGSGIKRPYASALPAIAKASGNESDLKQIPDSEISKVNCKNQGMDGAMSAGHNKDTSQLSFLEVLSDSVIWNAGVSVCLTEGSPSTHSVPVLIKGLFIFFP